MEQLQNTDEQNAVIVVLVGAGVIVWGGFVVSIFFDRIEVGWRKLRIWTLGGVRTLNHTLSVNCPMCQERMEAGSVVRVLSCGHVFHKNCDQSINEWLFLNNRACPVCRQTARCILLWKAPPLPTPQSSGLSSPSSPTRSGLPSEETDLEGQPSQDQLTSPPGSNMQNLTTPPPPQSSRSSSPTRVRLLSEGTDDLEGQDQPPPPLPSTSTSSSTADTSGLEEPLLPPSASQ